MMGTRKYLCWVIVALMFLSFFSIGGTSGCGSPHYDGEVVDTGSGNTSGNNNNSTNNNNNNTNDDSTDSNNNGSGNSGTPVNIDGTWEIVDGSHVMSYDQNYFVNELAGKTLTMHYVQGSFNNFQIEMKTNAEWYAEKGLGDAGVFSDFYAMVLRGNNVLSSGVWGGGTIMLDFENDDPIYRSSIKPTSVGFNTSIYYNYVGNNTYQATEEDEDSVAGGKSNTGYWENTVTLVNNSTLKWSYWWKDNPNTQILGGVEYYQELTLKRVN